VAEPMVDIGDRVILAAARERSPDALGTVIERDPHQDRDVLVRVLHGDGVARWRRRDSLRALGHRMPVADLAADLELMGLSTAHLHPTDTTEETQ
jgi:hypothetical protein